MSCKYLLITLVIIVLHLIGGCDPHDGRLVFKNATADTLVYSISDRNGLYGDSPLYTPGGGSVIWTESSTINPYSSKNLIRHGSNGWENYLNRCEGKTMRIFVFKTSLILNVPWRTIVKKQLYSKKYEITLEELESSDWQIVHDGW